MRLSDRIRALERCTADRLVAPPGADAWGRRWEAFLGGVPEDRRDALRERLGGP